MRKINYWEPLMDNGDKHDEFLQDVEVTPLSRFDNVSRNMK